jgi:hypothetical protein
MTEITIIAVQELAGRKQEYVRAFGYRTADAAQRPVEVALSAVDGHAMFLAANLDKRFPEIEVPDNTWAFVLNTGDVKVVRMRETP